MNRAEAWVRLGTARSGHLATMRPDGGPHLVVVTFALLDETVITAIDHKPKRTERLQRLRNIEANPAVSFLADRYDDDWDRLWWVRVDGIAAIWEQGESHARAVDALTRKYPQYEQTRPTGPVIALPAQRLTSWASTP